MTDDAPAPRRQALVTAAVCTAWLLLGGVAAVSIAILDLSQNFFSWQPSLREAHLPLLAYSLGIAGAWWLSGRTHGRVRVGAAILVTLALAALGGSTLAPEPTGILRSAPSPTWYRAGRLVLLLLPGATLGLRWGLTRTLGWPGDPYQRGDRPVRGT